MYANVKVNFRPGICPKKLMKTNNKMLRYVYAY